MHGLWVSATKLLVRPWWWRFLSRVHLRRKGRGQVYQVGVVLGVRAEGRWGLVDCEGSLKVGAGISSSADAAGRTPGCS